MKTLRIAALPLALMIALSACESGGDVSTSSESSSAAPTSSAPATSGGEDSSAAGGDTSSAGDDTAATSAEGGDTSATSPAGGDTAATSAAGGDSSGSSADAGGSDNMKLFGETFKWESGIEITAAKPVKFTPADTAAGNEGYKNAVKITFTIKNGSKEPFKEWVNPEVQSGTREGEKIFDGTNSCGMSPSTSLLPGKTLTFTGCYAVDDVNDITASVAPDYKADEAFWVTKK